MFLHGILTSRHEAAASSNDISKVRSECIFCKALELPFQGCTGSHLSLASGKSKELEDKKTSPTSYRVQVSENGQSPSLKPAPIDLSLCLSSIYLVLLSLWVLIGEEKKMQARKGTHGKEGGPERGRKQKLLEMYPGLPGESK